VFDGENSREWSVKANVGMPSNVMTHNVLLKMIKKIMVVYFEHFLLIRTNARFQSYELQFFDPF